MRREEILDARMFVIEDLGRLLFLMFMEIKKREKRQEKVRGTL